jgi:hypothetical protein
MPSWSDELAGFAENTTLPDDVRQQARHLLIALEEESILPSKRAMLELRKAAQRAPVCTRLDQHGNCPWARKNTELLHLRPPRPGHAIRCPKVASGQADMLYMSCPGYKKRRAE